MSKDVAGLELKTPKAASFPPADTGLDVDVIAGSDHYQIVTRLTGASPEDVIIGVIDGVLTIEARMCTEVCRDIGEFLMVDHRDFVIEQSFNLPPDADEDDISTEYSDGLLKVTIGREVIPAQVVNLRDWTSYAGARC